MQRVIWAPWRMDFISKLSRKKGACLFCDLPKTGANQTNLILAQGKYSFVILNRYPYTNGHLMVVPKRHLSEVHKLRAEEHGEIGAYLGQGTKIMKKLFRAQGFNIGLNLGKVAGAGIEHHLHYHLVPRWAGDTNFMPVFAEVKTIPEHLLATYQRLKPHFNS